MGRRRRRQWAEGGGGGDKGGEDGATAAVAMWGVRDKGNGREGAVLSMDDDDKANKPSPRAGTDANGRGNQQSDDRLASAWWESASSNADAHSGRSKSSNDVTNEGGGGRGFPHTTIHQKTAARAAAITAARAAAIAAAIAVETAAAANDDVGDQQRG